MCIVVEFITTLGILLSGLGHNDSTSILYIYSRAGGINIHGRYIQLLQSWCYSNKANNIIWTPTIQKSIQAILKSTTRTWTWSVDCPLKLYNECPWEEHDNEAGNFNGKSSESNSANIAHLKGTKMSWWIRSMIAVVLFLRIRRRFLALSNRTRTYLFSPVWR